MRLNLKIQMGCSIIYESVTILFTDFVGFTKIAESILPKQLLIELDDTLLWILFAKKYNIEKLKTIGDIYVRWRTPT